MYIYACMCIYIYEANASVDNAVFGHVLKADPSTLDFNQIWLIDMHFPCTDVELNENHGPLQMPFLKGNGSIVR